MPVTAICKECKNYDGITNGTNFCGSPEAPYTDFVEGMKECKKLNPDGACKHFKGEPWR